MANLPPGVIGPMLNDEYADLTRMRHRSRRDRLATCETPLLWFLMCAIGPSGQRAYALHQVRIR
ncbi:hypothetical protein CBM2599_A80058 [Cupriavidus taiwanensis]|nr:hypothetical protein CBM2599_A80058 [Cupriavidus taiwanensis]SOY92413.1 hypothetical protein CBM2600_A90057 [Cupriavidus taiwanensis]